MKSIIILFLSSMMIISCSPSKPLMKNKVHALPQQVSNTVDDSTSLIGLSDTSVFETDSFELESHEPEPVKCLSKIGSNSYGAGNGGGGSSDDMIESYEEPYSQPEPIKIIKIANNNVINRTTTDGHVVYKIPTEMSVRSTYQVLVRISKSIIHIHENLNGEVRESTITLTNAMEVKLVDPSPADTKMFDVVPDNNAVQLVENNESITQWTWNVTPLKSGTANLKIVVSIIKDGNKKEVVYQDTVKVNMDMEKEIPFFINKYWQWLLSTLVIPFVIWFYNRHKKDKEGKKKPKRA